MSPLLRLSFPDFFEPVRNHLAPHVKFKGDVQYSIVIKYSIYTVLYKDLWRF